MAWVYITTGIIDQETFDNVQRIRANVKRCPDEWGEAHPLTGLLYCADCGGKMYLHRVNHGKPIPEYTCSRYSKTPKGILCPTQHRIKADVVMELVADTLRAIADYAKNDRAEFARTVQEAQNEQAGAAPIADGGDQQIIVFAITDQFPLQ